MDFGWAIGFAGWYRSGKSPYHPLASGDSGGHSYQQIAEASYAENPTAVNCNSTQIAQAWWGRGQSEVSVHVSFQGAHQSDAIALEQGFADGSLRPVARPATRDPGALSTAPLFVWLRARVWFSFFGGPFGWFLGQPFV